MGAAAGMPIGVVLAGGRARRLGGAKATASLAGEPLLAYPVSALREAVGEVAVVAKPSTALPALDPGVSVWREPATPSHPLVGLATALTRAGGRAVLVCAGDMPFVPVSLLERLAGLDAEGAPAVVVASPQGDLQPLLARYEPAALAVLGPAAAEGTAPARAVVNSLTPLVVAVDDPRALFNVNTPEDLRLAESLLAAGR